MIPVLLIEIKTKDGLMLEGVYVRPERKSKTALIWLHGLSSRFSSGQTLMDELSRLCKKSGVGYFKFNNRGHDIVSRGPHGFLGSAFENFRDCILDIRAMIRFAKSVGYKNIILAGHSTGANKALYYLYKTRDRGVKGLVLAGPVSDHAEQIKKMGKKTLDRALKIAKGLKKKDPRLIMQQKYGIYSAARFLSLYSPGTAEDVFPYYNPKARWKELKSIHAPMAVIFGSREEHVDRPVKDIIEIFRTNAVRAKSFSGIIIKGAKHSFRGKEKELAHSIVKWIKEMKLHGQARGPLVRG